MSWFQRIINADLLTVFVSSNMHFYRFVEASVPHTIFFVGTHSALYGDFPWEITKVANRAMKANLFL